MVAIAVALLILRAAYDLTRKATQDLLDSSLPAEEKQWIQNYLSTLYPTVCSFHRLRTRKAGAIRFIDLHLAVDSNLTVSQSHEIADQITGDFRSHFPHQVDVVLHIEPCASPCSTACKSGCLLDSEEQKLANAGRQSDQTAT